nr:phosphoadenosine phosphosulfate reductase [Bacillota bacterium]
MRIEWTPEGIAKLADWWEEKTPQELLALAVERFGTKVALACSFGAEDVVLVDMLVKINPEVPIFYLDTDKHFRETYE